MSASNCVIYYGLRFPISEQEIEGLELETDKRITSVRNAKLQYHWTNFGLPDDLYYLFVGEEISIIGPEYKPEFKLSAEDFAAIAVSARAKLKSAGFEGSPQLYIQWMEDM